MARWHASTVALVFAAIFLSLVPEVRAQFVDNVTGYVSGDGLLTPAQCRVVSVFFFCPFLRVSVEPPTLAAGRRLGGFGFRTREPRVRWNETCGGTYGLSRRETRCG